MVNEVSDRFWKEIVRRINKCIIRNTYYGKGIENGNHENNDEIEMHEEYIIHINEKDVYIKYSKEYIWCKAFDWEAKNDQIFKIHNRNMIILSHFTKEYFRLYLL